MSNAIFQDSGKWSKINDYWGYAVTNKYKISGCALSLLLEMVTAYNRAKDTYQPTEKFIWSYKDIMNKTNLSKNGVIKMLETMEKSGLITSKADIKGREKKEYFIKPATLNKLVSEYLKEHPEYKK